MWSVKMVMALLREGGDPGWVPATLQGVGVSVARLLDVYNRLYTAKDSVWLTSGDELHILKVILSVSLPQIDAFRFCPRFFPISLQPQAKSHCPRGGSSLLSARYSALS